MRRGALVLSFVFAVACRREAPVVEGGSCRIEENGSLVGCVDPSTAAHCRDHRLSRFPCRGPAGCTKGSDRSASCDTSIGREGDPCAAETSGHPRAICSEDKRVKLACRDGRLVTSATCGGPKGCDPSGLDAYPESCDRTFVRVGDPCRHTGSYPMDRVPACSHDRKAVVECDKDRDGKFVMKRVCPGPKGCSIVEGLPSCDASVAALGSACGPGDENTLTCTMDGELVLVCDEGKWKKEGECPETTRCRRVPNRYAWKDFCEPAR